MSRRLLLLAAFCFSVFAAQEDNPLVIVNRVEPDWSNLTAGYFIEPVKIEMTVLSTGEPSALKVMQNSVPDSVVRALSQWRFKDGGPAGFKTVLTVPVRRRLDRDNEHSQRPTWEMSPQLANAMKLAHELDNTRAAQLLANLPSGEEPDNPRASLLIYYANNGASNAETTRKARRNLLAWLVSTYPQDSILASSFATINASGEPLADTEGSAVLKKAWLDAVKQYPDDPAVAEGASSFLRTTDASVAWLILGERLDWPKRSIWLGNVFAFAALGVNAVDPATGEALKTSGNKLPDDDFAASARKLILATTDLRLLLSAFETTSHLASELKARNQLPAGFPEYCNAMLKHTRDLYPQTSFTCDIAAPKRPTGIQTASGQVTEAKLTKRVQPIYPEAAKHKRLQGTVEFKAKLNTAGQIQDLELVRAPLPLYQTSYDTVLQWQYRPTLLNGVPVPVITDILVNFTLSQ